MAWVLRLIATAMLVAGASVLVAGVPVLGVLAESPSARTFAVILLQLAGVFVVAGGVALYLSRSRRPLLPNERATAGVGRPAVEGWLIVLAICLVALPTLLVLRLQPFLAEWSYVVELLRTSGMLEGASSNGGGPVLLAVAAALTPPFFELAALVAFVAASATLLILLLSRNRRFPRIYTIWAVLLAGLVMASVLGAHAALLAGEIIRQLIESSSASAAESAQLKEDLGRYTSIVGSTAPVLVWTLFGYLIWVPAMIFSRRARTTFGDAVGSAAPPSARPRDIEAITSPPGSL